MESHIEDWRRNTSGQPAHILVRGIAPVDALWLAAYEYAAEHLATALLVAGNMTTALRDLSNCAVAVDQQEVVGVASVFHGFAAPSITVAADTADAADALVRTLAPANGLLAVSVDQQMPEWFTCLSWSVDPWLVGQCPSDEAAERRTEPVIDVGELAAFYDSVRATYWCPAMAQAGGSRVVRDRTGAIVAAISVQFIIQDVGYAHLGALATAPTHQGQGLARTLVTALRSTLGRDGVSQCGLFAEAAHPWLAGFYERLGFVRSGGFRFTEIDMALRAALL